MKIGSMFTIGGLIDIIAHRSGNRHVCVIFDLPKKETK